MISFGRPPHEAVSRMVAALDHRGPDDRGIVDFELPNAQGDQSHLLHVSIGNNRLAILDLSPAGHQPMQDKALGLTITYNGETYNFEQLRGEIGTTSGPWRSQSDTEVVLRAYRSWGVEAFARLRGMFALAIWDERKRELILARDRFGIKPLYFSVISNSEISDSRHSQTHQSAFSGLVFASEVRALLASGVVRNRLSTSGIASYLRYGSVKAPSTIIEGVRSVMPGNFVRVYEQMGELHAKEKSYLSGSVSDSYVHHSDEVTLGPNNRSIDDSGSNSRDKAVAVLRRKLLESVQAHLVSDVPLGVFLSGGMDSSAIVALISEVSSEPPKTFSVVFDEEQFSEAPHSRLVAQRFKTDHQEVHLTEDRLLRMLPDALAALDQPTMDGINTYVVSKAVKDAGITVALSGLGGDELFAGYSTFRRALRVQSVSLLAKRVLRSASGVGQRVLAGSVQRQKFWQLVASDGGAEAVYSITRQLFSSDDVRRIADSGFPIADFELRVRRESALPVDTINAISILELQGYMSDTLLRDTDCTSMARSLEVRVPFLDVEIVPYVLSLPGAWKLNGSGKHRPKPLLADVVNNLLPAEFLQRPKMGFTLPFERWMQSRLHGEISAMLANKAAVANAALNPAEVASVWDRFKRAPRSVGWTRPWSLYVLTHWCKLHNVSI
jgi:asparagine synthase (glutamine-hydrolysing)